MEIIISFLMDLQDWMFITCIGLLFVVAQILIIRRYRNSALMLGNLASYIGIIGTFVGVFQGLQYFNPMTENIAKSLPGLLSGMKTAFLTSIVGMIANLIIKLICGFINGRNELKATINHEEDNYKLMDLFEKMERHLDRQLDFSSANLKNTNHMQELMEELLKEHQNIKDNIDQISLKPITKAIHDVGVNTTTAISLVFDDFIKKLMMDINSHYDFVQNELTILNSRVDQVTAHYPNEAISESVATLNDTLQGFVQNISQINLEYNHPPQIYIDDEKLKLLNDVLEKLDFSFENIKGLDEMLVRNSDLIKDLSSNITQELNKLSNFDTNIDTTVSALENLSIQAKISLEKFQVYLVETTHNVNQTVSNQSELLVSNFSNVLSSTNTLSKDLENQFSDLAENNINIISKSLEHIKIHTLDITSELVREGILTTQTLKEALVEHQKHMVNELGEAVDDWSEEIFETFSLQTKQLNTHNSNVKRVIESSNLVFSNVLGRMDMELKNSVENLMINLNTSIKNMIIPTINKYNKNKNYTDPFNYPSSDELTNYSIMTEEQTDYRLDQKSKSENN
ncbi:MAG: hypothetical protein ATN31_00990 [Candidatus Epulonipiscioides saccharophilum]|nr:MAG: hypothetical protein ATN31_00990 [Epulopiscium sp. AS2M-Bin001]